VLLWRARAKYKGHGARLLAGALLVTGLHSIDRYHGYRIAVLARLAFDHLLSISIGIAMVVLVLESARARSDELNDKMRRLSLLTAASTQTLSVRDVLEQVLGHLVESLGRNAWNCAMLEGAGQGRAASRASSVDSSRPIEKHERGGGRGAVGQRVLLKKIVCLCVWTKG